MRGVTRLAPIVPGEMQPVVWLDGSVKTGFVSGGAAEGRGFPQWAMNIFGNGKAHWFLDNKNIYGERHTLCGRVCVPDRNIYLPGNYPRCKACEKALVTQRKYGISAAKGE